jgi:TatD DNase family protein
MNFGKERNDLVRSLLPKIPRNRLLLETDAPYMGFKGCRKGLKKPSNKYPNVPSALPQVGENVAEMLGMTASELAEQTTKNAIEFFGIKV